MIDKDFYLDRFRFAAQKVEHWIRLFGKEHARQMVYRAYISDDYSEYAKIAFATAFGL